MAWFKVDDHFWSHPKTGDLSDSATALWLRAGSWSAGHLTDGLVPKSKLRLFRTRQRAIDELVDAGLWIPVSATGETLASHELATSEAFLFHDWGDYQPSRETVTAKRQANKARVDAWRDKKRNGVTGEEVNAPPVPSRPDPTRPDPLVSGGAAKRGTRIPDPFVVTPEMAAWAKARTPLVNGRLATERFINFWTAKTGKDATKLDWLRTWQNWLLKDQEQREARGGVKPSKDERALSVVEMGARLQAQSEQKAVGQ